ncbi:DUF6602 domain-containing protein [Streptomyces virginiae]|uniref:DUF6602 domain-containing protein n=1 Tax=Streptomyces virginiae TaxID=1961 RepID=UPI00331E30AD
MGQSDPGDCPSLLSGGHQGSELSADGRTTPQVDVLVLSPAYPPFLVRKSKKVYLAEGVVAAFECKLTLQTRHVAEAARTAAQVRTMATRHYGTPHAELLGTPFYGAHGGRSPPLGRPPLAAKPEVRSFLQLSEARRPLIAMMDALLYRMAWSDPSMRGVSSYFARIGHDLGDIDGEPVPSSVSRVWELDEVLRPATRRELMARSSDRLSAGDWGEWDMMLM